MENQENKITLDEIYNEISKRTSDAVKKTYLNKVIICIIDKLCNDKTINSKPSIAIVPLSCL